MKTYQDFQNQASSEKVTLAIINGCRRLSGFSLIGDGIYQCQKFDVSVLVSLTVNGEEFQAVASPVEMPEKSFYNDRKGQRLLVKPAAGKSPNRDFVRITQKYFFSNLGIALPWDLNAGEEVYFEPLIKNTSHFGVELDVANEKTAAIEGSGSVTFYNNHSFWTENFDSIFFDNQIGEIFSWNSFLPASEARLLFRGYVDSKTYSSSEIRISMKDLLYNLRSTYSLPTIGALGLRNDPALASAKQRAIYGRVKGFRPVNVDKVLNKSYPLQGEASFFFGTTVVVGSGTQFKKQVVPKDKFVVNGVEYTVSKVNSDTSLELTQPFAGVTTRSRLEIIPSVPKSFMNRQWVVSSHALSQPTFKIQQGSTTQRLILDTTKDIFDGDDLWIGEYPAGELVRVRQVVNSTIINLATSTQFVYPVDTLVHRPAIQNVRMNDLRLVYKADYDCDPISGRLLINEEAEENRAPLLETPDRITVQTGDDFFSGEGTTFPSYLKPGFKVRPQGTSRFYQVLSVEDQKIVLTEPYEGDSIAEGGALPQIMSIGGLSSFRERYVLRGLPVTSDLHGKYLKIFDSKGSVAIWFDIGNVGIDEPDHNCDRAIEITTLVVGDSQFVFIEKVKQKLELDEDAEFICTITGDTLNIESGSIGVRPPAKPSDDTGFTVTNLARNHQRIIFAPDVADSLDGQFVTVFDSNGSVALWIDVDNSGTLEPSHGCDRAIEITTIVTDDNAAVIREKFKAALLADGAWDVEDFGAIGLNLIGEMASVSLASMPAGFSLQRVWDGRSLYALHGSYFLLPYVEAGISKKRVFHFDIDDEGAPAPGVPGDSSQEISTISSTHSEAEFFEYFAAALESDGSLWTTDFSASGIIVTSIEENSVTTLIDAGNSGLTIELVQEGVAESPFAGRILQYKSFVFGDVDVLSCDVYGKTHDGSTSGSLLITAPEIVRNILNEAGSGSFIDEGAFELAQKYFSEELAFSIPETFTDKGASLTYREVINKVNGSVMGILSQSSDFKLRYDKLRPNSKIQMRLDESDILRFEIDSSNTNMVRTASVDYGSMEYNYLTNGKSEEIVSAESRVAQFILGTQKSRSFQTYCQSILDALRLAKRWAFILEYSSNRITFETKLQTSHLKVNDVVLVSHSKLYRRMGGASKTKIMMIEAIAKKGNGVEIVAIDLSNAFNRIAKYTNTRQNWELASDETRLLGGFYKDTEGLINSDPDSFDTNLYW